MRVWGRSLSLAVLILIALPRTGTGQSPSGSVSLADLAWPEAEKVLTADAVVILAIGNASKAHGPHLPLSTDFLQAEYVKNQVARRTRVVVAPSIGYGYYPPFLEYPGSTTLPLSVSRDVVADICRSYARNSKARRFYVVSQGVITKPVYDQAAAELKTEGILLRYTDWEAGKAPGANAVREQEKGSHADEIETSMLLYIAPAMVDMSKAVKEYGRAPEAGGRLIGNRPENTGVFSPSGVFGDATIASSEKGRRIIEGLIEAVLKDIESLRAATLPEPEADATSLTRFEGEYEIGPGETVRITRDGDMIAVDRAGKPKIRLQRAGKYRFGLWTTEARFFPDATGKVTDVMLSADGRDVLARRIK